MGIFVNGRARAVLADRLGANTKPSKDGHFRGYTYHWECIHCSDSIFIGRFFRKDDVVPESWPNGTVFRSIRTGEEKTISYQEPLPGFDEVANEG